MSENPLSTPDESEEEINVLVSRLHETERRLREVTGGEVDAVLLPGGHSYLLYRAQEKLWQSEGLLRIASRVTRLGGWSVDLRTHCVSWSDEVCAIHGMAPGSSPSVEEAILFHAPAFRGVVRSAFEACARLGTPLDLETQLIAADGRRVWVRSLGEAVRDAEGHIVKVEGAFQDISERKHAEEVLRETSQEIAARQKRQTQRIQLAVLGFTAVVIAAVLHFHPFAPLLEDVARRHLDILADVAEVLTITQFCVFAQIYLHWRGVRNYADEQLQVQAALRTLHAELELRIQERTAELAKMNEALRREIGERRQVEQALRASEAQFSSAFEFASTGNALVSPEGRFLKVNRALCQMLGYEEPELLARNFRDLTHADDRAKNEAQAHQLLDGAIASFRAEKRYLHREGHLVWALVNASLLRDNTGRPQHFITQIQDISERKRSGERIAEQAALIDQAREAIFVRDLEHRVIFWSRGAERLFVWTTAEALGRTIHELTRPDPATFQKASDTTFQEGSWRGEIVRFTKTGTSLTLESGWTLLLDAGGRPKSILEICSDITERKQLELQLFRAQRMNSIGTLAGGIAHDLNNALGPIIMSIDLLKAQFTDPHSRQLLEIIDSSAQHGADMVGQVLTFARGIEGRRTEVQVKHVISDIERIATGTFLKHLRIQSIVPHAIWPVQADPTQLHQVLLNLCVNARDAMPDGGQITIGAENVTLDAAAAAGKAGARPGPYVAIHIEDTGTGMPPEVVEKIFDPFFTTKEIGKGTGLGLSTSLAIVKSHGGFLDVSSTPGRGTRIGVYLPATTEIPAAKPAPEEIHLLAGHGETILFVDDEESAREMARLTLEAIGYRVILASNGAEAVDICMSRGPEIDVTIIDMMMPVMDGAAAIERVRQVNSSMPIIAVTGLPDSKQGDRATQLGVKHCLAKPYSAASLLTALQELIGKS